MSLGINWIRKEIPHTERWRPCQDPADESFFGLSRRKKVSDTKITFCGGATNFVEGKYGFHGGEIRETTGNSET